MANRSLQTLDISSQLGLSTSDEVDLEDAARVGNRIYVVSSHGRDKNGNLERQRYRFFAMDISGSVPSISLSILGYTTALLDKILGFRNPTQSSGAILVSLLNADAVLTGATICKDKSTSSQFFSDVIVHVP